MHIYWYAILFYHGLNIVPATLCLTPSQVHIWRRSYATPPPALTVDDPRHPRHDIRYTHVPIEQLPGMEALQVG